MEFNNKRILQIIFLSIVFMFFSAEAKCVPRNSSNNIASEPAAAPQASATSNAHAPATPQETELQEVTTPPPTSLPSTAKQEHSLAATIQEQFESSKAKAASILKGSDKNNSELTHLCGLTENPQLCAQLVGPFLKGLSDPISILHAAMQAAFDHVHLAIGEAKKLASDASSSGIVKDCIKTCLENFESALDDLDKSFTAIEQKDIGSLNSNLDSALTMVGTCEDTFDENPGAESPPMQEIGRKLSLMIDNCLAIRNAIKDIISPPTVF